MDNKKYRIKESWQEAKKYGWECYTSKDNGNLLLEAHKDSPAFVDFVEHRAPKMFEELYQSIIKEMGVALDDSDEAIDIAEELVGPAFGEILIWLAGWTNKDLLQEGK
tara:strand:+ start:464 stop:787 length:324 start_codon:yes stop_codon:yes gene_type:complete